MKNKSTAASLGRAHFVAISVTCSFRPSAGRILLSQSAARCVQVFFGGGGLLSACKNEFQVSNLNVSLVEELRRLAAITCFPVDPMKSFDDIHKEY